MMLVPVEGDDEVAAMPQRYGDGRCVLCNSRLSTYNPFAVCALCRRTMGGDEETWPTREPLPTAPVANERIEGVV